MKEILWFRNDLRVTDNALLSNATQEVLPIFIFDKTMLQKLEKDDKSISFLYDSVLNLKKELQELGLDLAIFYDEPKNVFNFLKKYDFDFVLSSYEFDNYSIKTDEIIETILPIKKYHNRFILNPSDHLKKDNTPYKVFTAFFNSLEPLVTSDKIELYKINLSLKKVKFDYKKVPTLEEIGFNKKVLPLHLKKSGNELLKDFVKKIAFYKENRDFFYKDATSKISVHLRFGLISPREIFNFVKNYTHSDFFIKELFWREFYNYILYHFPHTQFENFKQIDIPYRNNKEEFDKWCNGKTGIPIVDAAMTELNTTGLMHNRLRMVTSSFLTKNLLIDWKWGEHYFSKKLLDYEISTNIGSWQWSASTGVDSVPYFRVFNPYIQSKKFDKDTEFIKKYLPILKNVDSKIIHNENNDLNSFINKYPKAIVSISFSRKRAIEVFKRAKSRT